CKSITFQPVARNGTDFKADHHHAKTQRRKGLQIARSLATKALTIRSPGIACHRQSLGLRYDGWWYCECVPIGGPQYVASPRLVGRRGAQRPWADGAGPPAASCPNSGGGTGNQAQGPFVRLPVSVRRAEPYRPVGHEAPGARRDSRGI